MIYPEENYENSERDPQKEKSEALVNLLIVAVLAVASVIWWDRFKTPVMFVVTLGILVAVHEWGHFIAMKSCGVRVYEFALGFGPKLITYMRRNGTEYTIRAIPLGGFVYPKGMQPDDPITPDGINGRRPAERALCYLAGPLMNVVLGVFVFCLIGFFFGMPDPSRVLVGEVVRKKAAEQMQVVRSDGKPVVGEKPGLRMGDEILSVNNQPVKSFVTVIDEINPRANQQVSMTVRRRGQELQLVGTPQREESSMDKFLTITRTPEGTDLAVQAGDQLDRIGDERLWPEAKSLEKAQQLLKEKAGQPVTVVVWRGGDKRVELTGHAAPLKLEIQPGKRFVGQLGFQPVYGAGPRVSLGESVQQGLESVQNWFQQIAALFSRPKVLGKSVGGPVAIYSAVGQIDRLPALYYFGMLAQLSLSLAVFNLLPLPILDGGHMTLLAVEVLRRRRLEPATQKVVAMFGLAIIGMLFVYIFTKDIMKHFL